LFQHRPPLAHLLCGALFLMPSFLDAQRRAFAPSLERPIPWLITTLCHFSARSPSPPFASSRREFIFDSLLACEKPAVSDSLASINSHPSALSTASSAVAASFLRSALDSLKALVCVSLFVKEGSHTVLFLYRCVEHSIEVSSPLPALIAGAIIEFHWLHRH
jgi:hypothetical protein